jgi:MFS family permease
MDSDTSSSSSAQRRYAWWTLALVFVVFGSGIFSLDVMPPLFVEIARTFPMSNMEMGATMSAFHFASPLVTPIAGLLVDRFGPRRVLFIALLVLSLASFGRAFAANASQLTLIMFFMGVGFAFFGPNVPKVLGEVFPHEQLARVNGLVFSGVGFANALALGAATTVLLPLLGSWEAVCQATAAFTAVLAVAWYWHLRRLPVFAIAPDAPHSQAEESLHEPVAAMLRRIVSVRDLWGVALFFALPSFAYWGLLSQLPPVLAARGVSDPGLMVATMTGTSVFANILGGYLSDRLGNRRWVLMICAVGLATTLPLALVLEGPSVYAIMVLAGLFFGPIIPIALTIPVELPEIGTRYAGSALGFVFMIGNIGSILGPITLGYLIDRTGSPLTAFSVAACCLVASLLPLQLVRETGGPLREPIAPTIPNQRP